MKITKKVLQKKLDKLQKEIDNFKEENKLEVGKWYRNINGKSILINYQGGRDGYGINNKGNWEVSQGWSFKVAEKHWSLATDKEVEQALIKEAKKRGFKRGVRFNSVAKDPLNLEYMGGCNGLSFKYISKDNILVFDGWTCFNNGKWAEIIEDKKPTINGYEMEDLGKEVKFGCRTYNKDSLNRLYATLSEFDIDNFKLECTTITTEELKQVVDYLNK